MTDFTVYDTTTGIISSTGTCPDAMLSAQPGAGEDVLPVPSNPPYDRVKLTGTGAPYVYQYVAPGSGLPVAPPPVLKDLVDVLIAAGVSITWAAVESQRDTRLGL